MHLVVWVIILLNVMSDLLILLKNTFIYTFLCISVFSYISEMFVLVCCLKFVSVVDVLVAAYKYLQTSINAFSGKCHITAVAVVLIDNT